MKIELKNVKRVRWSKNGLTSNPLAIDYWLSPIA
jgi:hypothetical protein